MSKQKSPLQIFKEWEQAHPRKRRASHNLSRTSTGKWRVEVEVPAGLCCHIGVGTITRTLDTTNRAAAEKLAKPIVASIYRMFDAARAAVR